MSEPTENTEEQRPIYAGMSIAQRIWLFTQKFEGVEKTRKAKAGSFEYDYFNIDDIYAAAIPVMTACGIGAIDRLRAVTGETDTQLLDIEIFCLGEMPDLRKPTEHSDYSIMSSILMPTVSGNAFGSELTYKRRYGLVTMLNIRVPGDDDDAYSAEMARLAEEVGSAEGKPLDDIKAMLTDIDNGTERALSYCETTFGIVTLEELSLKQSASLKRTLRDIIRREGEDRGGDAAA